LPRKTFEQRIKTTYRSMKARAKKYNDVVEFTEAELLTLVSSVPRCRWCGKKITPAILNFDHKLPLARGGRYTLDNMEAIDDSCNRKKGALDEREFELLKRAVAWITRETGSDYAEKNILKRLAAGGAFIYG
jgi:5-methylcytosine-specific restriction endonuclease McrA